MSKSNQTRRCGNCGQLGHNRKTCVNPEISDAERIRIKSAQAKTARKCSTCGVPGHNKSTCPQLNSATKYPQLPFGEVRRSPAIHRESSALTSAGTGSSDDADAFLKDSFDSPLSAPQQEALESFLQETEDVETIAEQIASTESPQSTSTPESETLPYNPQELVDQMNSPKTFRAPRNDALASPLSSQATDSNATAINPLRSPIASRTRSQQNNSSASIATVQPPPASTQIQDMPNPTPQPTHNSKTHQSRPLTPNANLNRPRTRHFTNSRYSLVYQQHPKTPSPRPASNTRRNTRKVSFSQTNTTHRFHPRSPPSPSFSPPRMPPRPHSNVTHRHPSTRYVPPTGGRGPPMPSNSHARPSHAPPEHGRLSPASTRPLIPREMMHDYGLSTYPGPAHTHQPRPEHQPPPHQYMPTHPHHPSTHQPHQPTHQPPPHQYKPTHPYQPAQQPQQQSHNHIRPITPNTTYMNGSDIATPTLLATQHYMQAGSHIAYAVTWVGGGGVYLNRMEALVAQQQADAAVKHASNPTTFSAFDLCTNISSAESWIRQTLNIHSPPPKPGPTQRHNVYPPDTRAASSSSPLAPPAKPCSAGPPANFNPSAVQSKDPSLTTPKPEPDIAHPAQPAPPAQQPIPPPPQNHTHNQQPYQQPANSYTSSSTYLSHMTPVNPSMTAQQQHQSLSMMSPHQWDYSACDVTVRKHLLQVGLSPIQQVQADPIPSILIYLAAPGSARGIVISDPSGASQEISFVDGRMTLKPKQLPTIRLKKFAALTSVLFRAIDAAACSNSALSQSVIVNLRVFLRDLARQKESLDATYPPDKASGVLQWSAYLRYTYMAQTRFLPTGLSAEAAFEAEAVRRFNRASTRTASRQSHTTTTTQHKTNSTTDSKWYICPACALPNDHISPQCPSMATPHSIPESTRTATRAAINAANIPQPDRTNLLNMATAYYAKNDTLH